MKKTIGKMMGLVVLLVLLGNSALAQMLYSHKFDTLGGWPDSDAKGDLSAVYTVVGNEYLINPLQNNTYVLTPAPVAVDTQDVVVESTLRIAASQPESRAGIACRVSPKMNFYFFGLVAKGNYEIVKVKDGKGTILTSGPFPFGMLDNVNVRAECSGSTLIISANGRELGRVTDNSLPAGTYVGLVSVSPVTAATNATFADFTVSRSGQAAPGMVQTPVVVAPPPIAGAGGGSGSAMLPNVEDIALHNDANGRPGERQSLFNVGKNRVYVVMQLSGHTKAKFTAKWAAVLGTQETPLLESQYDNVAGDSRLWLYADRNWNPGLHKVNVYADGQLLQEMEFSVY